MILPVKTSSGSYNIVLERGILENVANYLSLDRRVFIVTDSGVPQQYAQKIATSCKEPVLFTIPQGEQSKQMDTFCQILKSLVEHSFTRTDCIVAVGGGVVGDLAGFAAATYMRGIDFYNVPTTVLSQVDSSIGGKTAIDFMGLKNIVGAFYPPRCVLIDPDTLSTLPQRQVSNGLAESVKMSLTSDASLFSLLETGDLTNPSVLEEIIARSLQIKKHVVEQDEHEAGLRKILNFGHTLAHAVESLYGMQTYFHGECVAIGMIPMCSKHVQQRLIPVLEKLKLPTTLPGQAEALIEACKHDKKMSGSDITVIYVPEIGEYQLQKIPFCELETKIRQVLSV